jgi:hypothetical protein
MYSIEQIEQMRRDYARKSYVYLVKMEGVSCYKIGYSTGPLQRVYSMQTSNPVWIELIGLRPGTFEDEKIIRQKTIDQCAGTPMKGEWLHCDQENVKKYFPDKLTAESVSSAKREASFEASLWGNFNCTKLDRVPDKIDEIFAQVAEAHDLCKLEFVTWSGRRQVQMARAEAAYRLFHERRLDPYQVGKLFGWSPNETTKWLKEYEGSLTSEDEFRLYLMAG